MDYMIMADTKVAEVVMDYTMSLSVCRIFRRRYKPIFENFTLDEFSNQTPIANMVIPASVKDKGGGTSTLEWLEIVIPGICAFGVIGNILNVIVLSRQRFMSRMDRLEKSSTYGLIALAFSDMMFCMMVFPHSFITEHGFAASKSALHQLYYRLYGVGLINLFMMNSTWLIVYMAVGRFIVVTYPFHARRALGTVKCVVTIIMVYILSTILTVPFFLHVTLKPCRSVEGMFMYEFRSRWQKPISRGLRFYITWIWPVLADFIPLLILVFINARLIKELRTAKKRRRRSCRGQTIRDSNQKVTLTLVIIVLMFFFLVTPGEILRYFNPYKSWGKIGHIIAEIANVAQSLNFAFNFVLYCVVSASFRQHVRAVFTFCAKKQSPGTSEMQTMLTPVPSIKKKPLTVDKESGHRYQGFA